MNVGIARLSDKKQKKLMAGGSIRISKGDIPLIVHPSRINEIARKFKRGVGHTLSLSPEELHHNINMEGGSFSDMAKSAFKTGVKLAAPVVKHMARSAIVAGSAALASAQPELIPFIPGGAMALTAASDHLFDNAGKYVDQMMPDSVDSGDADQPAVLQDAVKRVQNKVVNDPRYLQAQSMSNPYININDQMGTNSGYQHENAYGQFQAGMGHSNHEITASKARQHLHPKHAIHVAHNDFAHYDTPIRGAGFSKKIEKGSVCIGGNLIQHFGKLPQAVCSQPYAVNFSSRAFVSPAFQSLIR